MATMSMTATTTAEDSGRQMDDVDCSGYTFEDLFEYNNAVFEFQILDDWATSDLYANSWVNESRAAVVRDNLDGLFEGFPGGDNDWISTDERDAVREIGAKCIADMYTRIGIREGIPHRGGVDWNDVEFVEDGIGLEEVNLVPETHPQERSCSTRYALASESCREVPTSATNNLEISMFTKETETHNTRFNQLPNFGNGDYDNQTFTVAMNATNVTSATMMFTFPFVDGLRLANWTIQDNGVENLDAGMIEEIFLPDGSVTISMTIGYDKADWPMIRNVFFDMTTEAPLENDIPQWTENAPADNTIIPMISDGSEVVAITGEVMEDWASDNNAWGLNCHFNEQGWSSRMNSDGELLVTSGTSDSGTADCAIVDPYNASNEMKKTWIFGQPASFSVPNQAESYANAVDIESNPSLLVTNLLLDISATQGNYVGVATNVNLGSTPSVDWIQLTGISPGDFMIHVSASSEGMLDWNVVFDLGLQKTNTPPIITVDTDPVEGTQATWDAGFASFSLSGTAYDPDGGTVSLSATMCGETSTSFNQNMDTWIVSLSTARCVSDGETEFNVVVTVVDSVGAESFVEVNVPSPYDDDSSDEESNVEPKEDSGLPSIGMFATVVAMLGAALLLRRD
ncbi:MAG: hypothetical protein DWC02_04230 [Candidatus Poseidoniales archaeon]|nr:MAG: hypothetical protein DWC02_04230 [Candidatus Poseidoniales archaeon]